MKFMTILKTIFLMCLQKNAIEGVEYFSRKVEETDIWHIVKGVVDIVRIIIHIAEIAILSWGNRLEWQPKGDTGAESVERSYMADIIIV